MSAPVRWHRFEPTTFDLDRDVIALGGGYAIALYPPERSIVDAYRMRHLEGDQLGREALKVWLGRLRDDMRVLL